VKRAYFDTSAIVKLSHVEACSQSLIDYLEQDLEVSTSIVSEVEAGRALGRAGVDRDEAINGFYLLALDDDVRREAARIGSLLLRSLDAIHVATALAIGDRDLEFVTYDDRQAEAARSAGLKVVQPGR
jgi:predicted nucleic acid-binding protein